MESYRRLIQDLFQKSSKPTVYRKMGKIREEYNMLISKEDAACILAVDQEVDLFDYIEPSDVERIRAIMVQHSSSKSSTPKPSKKAKTTSKKTTEKKKETDVKLVFDFGSISIENLSKRVLNEAKEMGNVYSLFYILENSIRDLISRTLTKNHGKDWWNTATISTRIKKRVAERMTDEEKAKWHGRRDAHPIYYTTTGDLSTIIEANWNSFKNIGISSPQWVKTYITEIIERSRNIVMHCNPLSKRDIARLRSVFEDWMSIISPEILKIDLDSSMTSSSGDSTPEIKASSQRDIKRESKTTRDSIFDYIEKKHTSKTDTYLLKLADKELISTERGRLKISKRINHLQARVLVSLLISFPDKRTFKELYDDVLYPSYSVEGGDTNASFKKAVRRLLVRDLVNSRKSGYRITSDKIGEAMDYIDFRIEGDGVTK